MAPTIKAIYQRLLLPLSIKNSNGKKTYGFGEEISRLYKKGVGSTVVTNSLHISVRHVKRLWSRIRKTGTIHATVPISRPTKEVTTKMIGEVLTVHENGQTVSIKATKQYTRYWELQEE